MHKLVRLLCLGILCLGMVAPASRASAAIVTGEIYFTGGDPLNYLSPSVVPVGVGPEFSYWDSVAEFSINIDPAMSVAIDAVLKGPTAFFPWDLRLALDEPWPALVLTQNSFDPGMTFSFSNNNNTLHVGWGGAIIFEPVVNYTALFSQPPGGRAKPVPEPGTLTLLLACLSSMYYMRRRRRV